VAPERPDCRRRWSGIRQARGVPGVYRGERHVEVGSPSVGGKKTIGLLSPAANDCTLRARRSSQQGWPRSGMVAPGRCTERISRMGLDLHPFARRPAEKEVGELSFHAARSSRTHPGIWGRTCSIESATRRRSPALMKLSRRRQAGSRAEQRAARPRVRTCGWTYLAECLEARVSLGEALANGRGEILSCQCNRSSSSVNSRRSRDGNLLLLIFIPSKVIAADSLPARDRAQGTPHHPIDVALDETNAAVAQE
jgi:hypothetical protein